MQYQVAQITYRLYSTTDSAKGQPTYETILTIAGTTVVMTFAAMAADEVPKFEVSADYSFAHFDPARNFLQDEES